MHRDPNGVGVVLQRSLSHNAANPVVTVSMAYELQYGDGMNSYEYLRSNPNKYGDPSGLLPDWIGEFLYAATGGEDSWSSRFLESETSQDVADAAGLVGSPILVSTPGAGAGAACLASDNVSRAAGAYGHLSRHHRAQAGRSGPSESRRGNASFETLPLLRRSTDYADVPFENHFAERQIRPAVILRKNSQSNRSGPRSSRELWRVHRRTR